MKKLIWLLPLLIILGAMLVTVEMKSQTHEVIIQYDYGNLVDTKGRIIRCGSYSTLMVR